MPDECHFCHSFFSEGEPVYGCMSPGCSDTVFCGECADLIRFRFNLRATRNPKLVKCLDCTRSHPY